MTSTTELASSGLPESSGVPVFHVDGAITGVLDSAGVKDAYSSPLSQGMQGCGLLGEVPATLASFTMHSLTY